MNIETSSLAAVSRTRDTSPSSSEISRSIPLKLCLLGRLRSGGRVDSSGAPANWSFQ